MATESEFVTAPSTPEADSLKIVVEQRLLLHDDGEGGSRSTTIFRVPAHVRDANKELYEPRLVSVGPYYRGRAALRAMEQHKWRYLRELLRERRPRTLLARCVEAVRDVEHRARCCYVERTDIFDAAAKGGPLGGEVDDGQSRRGPDDFGEMLLLDGCFVLRFFIKWHNEEEDDICDVGWGLPLLHSDLLLLENQIPFFVLEALFRLVVPEDETSHLHSLILPHLRLSPSTELSATEMERAAQAGEIRHLLHLLYEAVVPTAEEIGLVAADASPPRPAPRCVEKLRQMGIRVNKAVSERFAFMRGMAPQLPRWIVTASWFSKCRVRIGRKAAPEPETTTRTVVVPPVTLLRKAGVRFEKKAPAHMLDVTFDAAAGVVRMPRLEVDHASWPLLVNLVAFEQTVRDDGRRRHGKPVSCYAALVGSLVRTGKDVEHLQKRGIVDNLLGTDDDAAAKFFQQLGDCASLEYEDHSFAAMFADLPVPQPGSGGTSSKALPAPARNKKEPRRVTHIPGISKVKDKVQDAWHHQKDEFACQEPRPPVSRYAALVGSRVRTGEDVEHLQKRGVVDNLLGTDDDAAAKVFQQLGDCASLEYEDHSFAAMFADLNRYYRSSWRGHKAEFLRDHCSSPWAALVLVVAGCAFCFALFKFSTTGFH
nr:UPF0481 protein At3g47200-like [Setaria viridis]